MRLGWIVLCLALFSHDSARQAWASPCGCLDGRSEPAPGIGRLTLDLGAITYASVYSNSDNSLYGRRYSLEQIRGLQADARYFDSRYCSKISEAKFTIEARGSLLSKGSMSYDDGLLTRTYYQSYIDIRNYAKDQHQSLFQGTDQEVATKIRNLYSNNGGASTITADQAKILSIFHNYMYTGLTAEDAHKYAESVKNRLIVDEKLRLAQIYMHRQYHMYSAARAVDKDRFAGSAPTEDQILMAMRANNDQGYFDYSDMTKSGARALVVCRDIAPSGALFLRSLGLDKSYVIAGARTEGARHATVVVQDPRNPNIIHSINGQERLTILNKEGGAALYQGTRDVSLVYGVVDPFTNKAVAIVDSEFYKTMRLLGGYHIATHDPTERTTANILRTGITLNQAQQTSFGLAYASHADQGWQTVGATARKEYSPNPYFNSSLGTYIGYLKTPDDPVGAVRIPAPTNFLSNFYQVELDGRSPCLQLGSQRVCGRLEAGTGVAFNFLYNLEDKEQVVGSSKLSSHYSFRNYAGVAFDAISKDNNSNTHLWIRCEAQPGAKNIREQTHTIILNKCSAISASSVELMKDANLLIGSAVIYHPGLNGFIGQQKFGIESNRFRLVGGTEARLTSETPNFVPGAKRKITLNLSYASNVGASLGSHPFEVGLGVLQDLESAPGTKPATIVNGGLNFQTN